MPGGKLNDVIRQDAADSNSSGIFLYIEPSESPTIFRFLIDAANRKQTPIFGHAKEGLPGIRKTVRT